MTELLAGPSSINATKLAASTPKAWHAFPLSHSNLGSISAILAVRRVTYAARQSKKTQIQPGAAPLGMRRCAGGQ